MVERARVQIERLTSRKRESRHQRKVRVKTSLAKALRQSKAVSASARTSIIGYMEAAGPKRDSLTRLNSLANAILASDFSHNMESWLTDAFSKGIPTVFDKSMDAVYNATHIGGGQLHRLFDGSHTISGAWGKVHDALPDDNFGQEVWGFLTAYWKDLSTHIGMPVVGMSQGSYQTIATTLSDTFHIPKPWFQDMLHVNAAEVFGTAIAAISLALRWSKAETEEFSRLAGGLGIASLASANPALAVITLATLARAFMRAKERDDYRVAVDGLAKGGFGTGVFLATSALIPGPVWVGILAGMCVAVVASKVSSNVHISEISGFVVSGVKEGLSGLQVT